MKTALDYTNEAITRSNEIRAGSPLTPGEELGRKLYDLACHGASIEDMQACVDEWKQEYGYED